MLISEKNELFSFNIYGEGCQRQKLVSDWWGSKNDVFEKKHDFVQIITPNLPMSHTQMTHHMEMSHSFVDLDQSETSFWVGPPSQKILKLCNTFFHWFDASVATLELQK